MILDGPSFIEIYWFSPPGQFRKPGEASGVACGCININYGQVYKLLWRERWTPIKINWSRLQGATSWTFGSLVWRKYFTYHLHFNFPLAPITASNPVSKQTLSRYKLVTPDWHLTAQFSMRRLCPDNLSPGSCECSYLLATCKAILGQS